MSAAAAAPQAQHEAAGTAAAAAAAVTGAHAGAVGGGEAQAGAVEPLPDAETIASTAKPTEDELHLAANTQLIEVTNGSVF